MRFNARRLKRFEGPLFHGQIRFYVHVRRGGTFMAEPQCNDCNVYTRLQHVHCSRVSNDVGRDVTLLQPQPAGRSWSNVTSRPTSVPCRTLWGEMWRWVSCGQRGAAV